MASASWPANTVVRRAGFFPCRIASAAAGRAFRAEQPHTEFTTTSVVPPASLSAASTASGVRSSVKPIPVSSARIGATNSSGYIVGAMRRFTGMISLL